MSKPNRHGLDDWRSYGRSATMRAWVVSDPFEHARLLRLAGEWRRSGDLNRGRSAVRLARFRREGKLQAYLSTFNSTSDPISMYDILARFEVYRAYLDA